jgi:hypothetical protein
MKSNLAKIDWTLSNPPSPYKNLSCIYFVHLRDPKDPSKPFPIPRFIGTDPQGTLEIGQTVNLASKIWQFKSALFGTPRGDAGGWNLGYLFDNNDWLQKTFGTKKDLLASIRFNFIKTEKELLQTSVQKVLDDYYGRFAEPPVLMGQTRGIRSRPKEKASIKTQPDLDTKDLDMIMLSEASLNPLTKRSCIYWVHLMSKDGKRPVPINRFNGIDVAGMLTIGNTRDLGARIRQIKYDIKHEKRHGEWGIFHHIYDRCSGLKDVCGPIESIMDRLRISYLDKERGALHRGEVWAFDKYINRFAEIPPYNSQIPGDTRSEGR